MSQVGTELVQGPASSSGRGYRLSPLHELRRHWIFIVAPVVILAVAGYGLSKLQTSKYRATANAVLSSPLPSTGNNTTASTAPADATQVGKTEAQFLSSNAVMQRIAAQLGLSPSDVRSRVTVTSATDSAVVSVSATDTSPDRAVQLVNAVKSAYEAQVAADTRTQNDQVSAQLTTLQTTVRGQLAQTQALLTLTPDDATLLARRDNEIQTIQSLSQRQAQLALSTALSGSAFSFFEVPVRPSQPYTPKAARNAAIAALLGLVIGAGLIWWRALRRPAVESAGDAAAVLDAPLLGELGRLQRRRGRSAVVPTAGETIQSIFPTLTAVAPGEARVFVVAPTTTGSLPPDVALELASTAARSGRMVVLVDGNQRQPALTKRLGADRTQGLSDLAEPGIRAIDYVQRVVLSADVSLGLLPAGSKRAPQPSSPAGGWHSVFAMLAETFDVVIVSGPALAFPEALEMAACADATVAFVSPGASLADLAEIRSKLDLFRVVLVGYVFDRGTSTPSSTRSADGPPARLAPSGPQSDSRTTDKSPAALLGVDRARSEP